LLYAREVLDEMPVRATICVVLPEIVGCRWRIIWIHIRFHNDLFMEGNFMHSTLAMYDQSYLRGGDYVVRIVR
jgi:hypothetical protein